jgi:hypothetical protein
VTCANRGVHSRAGRGRRNARDEETVLDIGHGKSSTNIRQTYSAIGLSSRAVRHALSENL